MDVIDELLDDETFDPKKLFDEKQYSTLIINRQGFNKKQNETADMLEALVDEKTTRPEKEEIFIALKEANAQLPLVNAIKSAERTEEKAQLVAACWESGLDFTGHYLFFTELACSNDFRLAMEALTVVENCESTLDEPTLSTALEIAQTSKSQNTALVNDLIEIIKSRIA
jgi:hypothetical protein